MHDVRFIAFHSIRDKDGAIDAFDLLYFSLIRNYNSLI